MAPQIGVSVGPFGGSIEGHETELRDRQSGPQNDRHAVEVGDLEREAAAKAGVDEAGRGVDDQTEPAQTRFPFDSRDDVIGELDALDRPAEDELAGVDDELAALRD